MWEGREEGEGWGGGEVEVRGGRMEFKWTLAVANAQKIVFVLSPPPLPLPVQMFDTD